MNQQELILQQIQEQRAPEIIIERRQVPCKYCGTPTPMTATRTCDFCWELETRIRANPDIAAVILRVVTS